MSSRTDTCHDLFESIFQIFSFFREVVSTLNTTTNRQEIRCRNELERLYLWADEVRIQDGTLDETLSRSSTLRSSLILILLELGNAVCNDLFQSLRLDHDSAVKFDDQRRKATELMHTAHASVQNDPGASLFDDTDPSCSETFDPSLDDVLDSIAVFNDCLMDLSPALERPALDVSGPQFETSDLTAQESLLYCRKIRDRFPELPLYLVGRLGIANLQRTNRLRIIKRLRQRIGKYPGYCYRVNTTAY